MAIIDGRQVVGAGAVQFQKECMVDVGTAPPIRFRVVDTGEVSSGSAKMEGVILTTSVNLAVGAHYAGTQDYTVTGTAYTLIFIVERLDFGGGGGFYEARYSLTLQ